MSPREAGRRASPAGCSRVREAQMEMSNGDTPIAGWFFWRKILWKWVRTGGTAILGNTQIPILIGLLLDLHGNHKFSMNWWICMGVYKPNHGNQKPSTNHILDLNGMGCINYGFAWYPDENPLWSSTNWNQYPNSYHKPCMNWYLRQLGFSPRENTINGWLLCWQPQDPCGRNPGEGGPG